MLDLGMKLCAGNCPKNGRSFSPVEADDEIPVTPDPGKPEKKGSHAKPQSRKEDMTGINAKRRGYTRRKVAKKTWPG